MHKKMTFKELLKQDVSAVFLNPEEFVEPHVVNGKEMVIVIDNYELSERQQSGQPKYGIFKNLKLVYTAASDFGPLPAQGSLFTLDKRDYLVVDAVSEGDIYLITIGIGDAL